MKSILYSLLILLVFSNITVAQQTGKTDDALLLDYYQNQRFADAFNYLKGIYGEPVNDVKALSQLAYTSQMAGKLADAENYYQLIYNKDTTNQTVLYNLAGVNLRRGNSTKAEAYYKKYLLKDTTNFSVYKQMATISFNKVDIMGHLYYLQKANKLNPVEADVASDLSDRYVQLKQVPQAKKILSAAIVADLENVMLLQSLLKINSSENNWVEATKTGEQLLLLGDSSIATVTKTGRAYYNTKSYECGINLLSKIPEANQTETMAYIAAVCYKQLKDHKNAIQYFNKAIKLSISPSTGAYYNEMADSYETLNQAQTAKDKYQKGLLYDDGNPLTYYFLANLYDAKLKDKKNALKYFKKYIASKPDEKQKDYLTYSKSRVDILNR